MSYRLSFSGGMAGAVVTGDPYEQGYQHGRALVEVIEANLVHSRQTTEALIARGRGDDLDAVLELASDHHFAIRPNLREELVGIAEGAGVSYRDILELNFPANTLVQFVRECSHAAASPEVTGDGQIRLGKTRDLKQAGTTNVILQRVFPDGLETVEMTHAGSVLITGSGLNSHGLHFTTSGVWGRAVKPDYSKSGEAIFSADVGEALRVCRTVDEFTDFVSAEPVLINLNLIVADADGAIAALEVATNGTTRHDAVHGRIARTNHYHDPSHLVWNPTPDEYPSSFRRYDTLVETLGEGGIGQEQMWGLLSSHEYLPWGSICRHPAEGFQSITTSAAVTTWPAGHLEAWVGQPCYRDPSRRRRNDAPVASVNAGSPERVSP